ncbi:hypothetical protein BegalDRAFT_1473 [Beggiatoa alba B18LD]|uniref:Uncharacterized protein n=2 Tax=Beggiatoa alba TaxID=1022 RepID=I3CFG8_9GAMM|nr:hypothetical protein BegalDRAFT_1473 [Beggiatoa alba B18LD]
MVLSAFCCAEEATEPPPQCGNEGQPACMVTGEKVEVPDDDFVEQIANDSVNELEGGFHPEESSNDYWIPFVVPDLDLSGSCPDLNFDFSHIKFGNNYLPNVEFSLWCDTLTSTEGFARAIFSLVWLLTAMIIVLGA